MTINCLFLEVFYCNCQFIAHVSIVAGSKTMCTAIASMSQLFGVPTRNSCCYSKAGSSQSTIRVGKYFWQLFQVLRSYSECHMCRAICPTRVASSEQMRKNMIHNLIRRLRVHMRQGFWKFKLKQLFLRKL